MADTSNYSTPINLRASYDTLSGKIPPYQWIGALLQSHFALLHWMWSLFGAKLDARIDAKGQNVLTEYQTVVNASGNWAAFEGFATAWWNGWNQVYLDDINRGLADRGPWALESFITFLYQHLEITETSTWKDGVSVWIENIEATIASLPVWIKNPFLTMLQVYTGGIPPADSTAIGKIKSAVQPAENLDEYWNRRFAAKIASLTKQERDLILGGSGSLDENQAIVLRALADDLRGAGYSGSVFGSDARIAIARAADLWNWPFVRLYAIQQWLADDPNRPGGPEYASFMNEIYRGLFPPALPEGLEPLPIP